LSLLLRDDELFQTIKLGIGFCFLLSGLLLPLFYLTLDYLTCPVFPFALEFPILTKSLLTTLDTLFFVLTLLTTFDMLELYLLP
jgi:hypothetical protein